VSKKPNRMEQLGALMTAMIAVIVGGASDVRVTRKRAASDPVLEDTPENRFLCQKVAWRRGLSRNYVLSVALGKRVSPRVADSLRRARRKFDRQEAGRRIRGSNVVIKVPRARSEAAQ